MPKVVNHQQYRQELLSKCFDLFAQKGYSTITMREIAEEIGVSTGTLYHYFPNKKTIFEQLMAQTSQQDLLKAAAELGNPPTLEAKIFALMELVAREEDYIRKQLFLGVDFCQQQGLEEVTSNVNLQKYNQVYRQGIAEFLGLSNPAIAKHITCLIDGLILERTVEPDNYSFQEQAELLAQMLTAYLQHNQSAKGEQKQ